MTAPSVRRQVALRSRYGTASEVACASDPPPSAPSAWPGAQARLISAKPQATSTPIRSALSLTNDIAGVHDTPNASAEKTATTASTAATSGQGRIAVATADADSPI